MEIIVEWLPSSQPPLFINVNTVAVPLRLAEAFQVDGSTFSDYRQETNAGNNTGADFL